MRQRAAASLLYQSKYAEAAFRNLLKLIFLKIVGRILAFYKLEPRGVRSFDVKGKQIKGEKKAIKLLETFEYKPEKYAERVNHIFEVLGLSLFECYDMTEKLYKEVKKVATEINNFLNEENSDERKQI